MDLTKEFDDDMAYLMQGLGLADRHAVLSGYCTGLMLYAGLLARQPKTDPLGVTIPPGRTSWPNRS